jgi:hypothetical protein
MTLIRRDNNEILYYNILWLVKDGVTSVDYYEQLIRNSRALFISMRKDNLLKELDDKLKNGIERKTGHKINDLFIKYKNMPYLNNFIRKPNNPEVNIYKYQLKEMFNDVENWIFLAIRDLASEIRFSMPPKQTI